MKKIKIKVKTNGLHVRDEEHLKAQIRYPHLVQVNRKKYNRKKLPKIDF